MPEIASLLIPIIIGGVEAGTSLYGALNAPSPPNLSKLTTTPQPQTAGQNAAQTAAVTQALPTLQSLTGGSVSPEYAAQYGATQTGLGNDPAATGNIQAAINQFFGLVAPGSSGLTPSPTAGGGGTTSILDLLANANPARTPRPGGGGGDGLVDSLLAGNEFRGLAA